MSQNKTVIPGLDQNDYYQGGNAPSYNPQGGAPQQNFYQRSGAQPKGGTVVPGMAPQPQQTAAVGQPGFAGMPQQPQPQQVHRTQNAGKPIVGFLYSVSRLPQGEFWPLYLGRNIMGQSADCDIVLPEGTISGTHAVLLIRKNQNPEKVIAQIQDNSSTNGTMLNGVSLEFTPVPCKNGDIITVGFNYELFLILVDPSALGLKPSENFIAVKTEEPANNFFGQQPPFGGPDGRPTRVGGDQPNFYGPSTGGSQGFGTSGYVPQNGTVGMDGSISYNGKGGTVAY